jgi:hypothetical protein
VAWYVLEGMHRGNVCLNAEREQEATVGRCNGNAILEWIQGYMIFLLESVFCVCLNTTAVVEINLVN